MAQAEEVRRVRRRVLVDGLGISFTAGAFGLVYGLAAREAGLSIVEAMAMSLVAFAGAAQFAAVGLVAQGAPWVAIVLFTALLNARHLLYAAALAPWFASTRRATRAVAAHALTDESFALTLPAFRALGRLDLPSYGIAVALTMPVWLLATGAGYVGGELLPDPRTLGLDIVFPAAMAGLAVALVTDRASLIAAAAGALIALIVALVAQPAVGILAGGLAGPLVGMTWRGRTRRADAGPGTEA